VSSSPVSRLECSPQTVTLEDVGRKVLGPAIESIVVDGGRAVRMADGTGTGDGRSRWKASS
jgi:hypothetical protein